MDAIEALRTRRCVRAFRREAVDRETLEEVVDCGRLAPTALNVQPWEFVVVTDKTMLQRIAQATDHGRFIADAGACIVVLSKATKYYLEDGSAATENILLACHARGLGACWVAGDKKPYADDVVRLVGAPESCKLVSLIPIGHAAEEPTCQKRTLADVLHWETL